jgi:hypothetical protein
MRCGRWYNRVDLRDQLQWGGASLINLRIYVCQDCYDRPQEQLRAIALPADPIPIRYPLPEPFDYDSETDETTPFGQPVGLEPYAISPMGINASGQYVAYGVDLQPLSVISNGTTTISVSCRAAHGMTTGDQVSVSGLSDNLADGFFSVVVTSGVAFTYTTATAVTTASLLETTSRIVTANVGLPRGQTTIAQVT